jgi:hypothetical protein
MNDAQTSAMPGKPGWIVRIVLTACALFLGWRVVSIGLASLWDDSDPETAVHWRPSDPEALLGAADIALDRHQFSESEALARRSLSAYPLDGRPYRDLAEVADATGNVAQARRLLGIATLRSPRDPATRGQLLEYALRANDLSGTLRQMDVLMRIKPETIYTLGPGLVSMSQDPQALGQLGRLLATRPPWRLGFLVMTAGLEIDPFVIDRVFASRGGDDPLPSGGTEADLLLQRQIRDNRWGSAHATWVQTLTKAERAAVGNVYDGAFLFPLSGRGFDWQLPVDGTGYDVIIHPSPEAGAGNVMQVRFDDLPLDYHPVSQRLALAPGRYRLSGMAGSKGFDIEGGLYWTVACGEGKQQNLGSSDMLVGTAAWHAFAAEFDVPGQGCSVQWLRLDLAQGDSMAQPQQGSAMFSGLAITRLEDSPQEQPTTGRALDQTGAASSGAHR